MVADPEAVYARIADARPETVRDQADTLRLAYQRIDEGGDELYAASGVPAWSGQAASAFDLRSGVLLGGVRVNANATALLRDAVEAAAGALEQTTSTCDGLIGRWRSLPPLPDFVKNLMARLYASALTRSLTSYDKALGAAAAMLDGRTDLDLGDLDDDIRAWIERGLDNSEHWYDTNGSSRGPLIPDTEATGDDSGLVPQGLGYDPASGLLLQSYYDDDHSRSTMTLIDPRSGQKIGDVTLEGNPGHAGGVAVDGDNVVVTSGGTLYTYSLNDIQNASPGDTVPTVHTQSGIAATSYGTVHDGHLYVGDFDHDKLYSYHRDTYGDWVPDLNVDGSQAVTSTPGNVQGVTVVDGHYVFTTSSGRTNDSQLVTQDMATGDRSEPYPMPNMAEGVVDVNGQLITTYESGAAEYDQETGFHFPWQSKTDDLWASPYMTRTPLSELGLSESPGSGELALDAPSLSRAVARLADPQSELKRATSGLQGLTLAAADLGRVPSAPGFARSVTDKTSTVADSLDVGAAAIGRLADDLALTRDKLLDTDAHVHGRFSGQGH